MPLKRKNSEPRAVRPSPKKDVNYTQELSKPKAIRTREQRSGCLGGFMFFAFLFCLSLGLAVFGWMAASDMLSLNKTNFSSSVTLPMEMFTSEEYTVTKEDGSKEVKTKTTIDPEYLAKTLKDVGLIQYDWLFELYCQLSHAETKVDPGEYELKSSYDYRALVQNMQQGVGGMRTVDVTIPEGFTVRDVFQRLSEKKVSSLENLQAAATDGVFKYDFLEGTEGQGIERLEGYLFPDTYQFYVGTEASSAINRMLSNFSTKFTDDMKIRAAELGYTMKDIVTMASIIEKEAKLDEDRAYVASVIYNRLNIGMTLGMDTTVLYLYPEHKGEPTAEMLATDSPYNTHIYNGLPPTPICNPGMASIEAALYPAESDYYYFYADMESGKLNFFTNYTDFDYYVQTHRDA